MTLPSPMATVLVRSAPSAKTGLPQLLDVAHEAERAGAGEFVTENARAHLVLKALTADNRCGEIDFDIHAETGMRLKFAPAAVFFDANRL